MRTLTTLIQGQPIEYMTSWANRFVWESSNFFMLQARLCKVLISSYRIEEGGRELFVAFDSYGKQPIQTQKLGPAIISLVSHICFDKKSNE